MRLLAPGLQREFRPVRGLSPLMFKTSGKPWNPIEAPLRTHGGGQRRGGDRDGGRRAERLGVGARGHHLRVQEVGLRRPSSLPLRQSRLLWLRALSKALAVAAH